MTKNRIIKILTFPILLAIGTFALMSINNQIFTGKDSKIATVTTEEQTVKATESIQKLVNTGRIIKNKPSQESISTLNKELRSYAPNYAVYVKDLNTDTEYGSLQNEIMTSASTYKVLHAILILQQIENNELELGETIDGLSVENLLVNMIQFSDNHAMDTLETHLTGCFACPSIFNELVEENIGEFHFYRNPYEATARDAGLVMELLYNYELLNIENTEHLIKLLSNTWQEYDDRIVAGVPEEVQVAHKIGTDEDQFGVVYNDLGIVYGEKTDYVIAVYSRNEKTYDEAAVNIAKISEIVYNHLNHHN